MDALKNAVGNKLSKDAQPGNQFESRADNAANQRVNEAASDFGVPQQDVGMVDEAIDGKINDDIPGGN